MKRIRLGVGKKALVVLASLAAGAGTIFGCIPDPDISGLPPFDASVTPGFDANALNGLDAGNDVQNVGEAGDDGPGVDAPSSSATITGIVIDYAQGEGRGVAPGATISIAGGPTTTTNAFGAFALVGAPIGAVLLNVTKATDKTSGVAYSSTQIALTLADGQTVSVFPVIHEGCSSTKTMGSAGSIVSSSCGPYGNQPGVQAELQYGASSFLDPSTNAIFTGTARIEMIPIAFPVPDDMDFTWSLGLPGVNSPLTTIGAAEFRVLDDSTGEPLTIRDNNVTATVPTWQVANTTTFKPFFFDATGGTWTADSSGETLAANSTVEVGDGPDFHVVDVTKLQHLGWTSITNPGAATTCVTGSVTVNTVPTANVFVRATGLNYFGVSSALTDSSGTFCVDVAAPVDGGALPQIGIAAGTGSSNGAFFTLPVSGYQVSSVGGGSCATKTNCTALGAITLAPFNSTCVNGIVSPAGGNALPSTVNVFFDVTGLSSAETADGVQVSAYIGTAAVSDGGAFCATAAGGTIELFDPVSSCYTPEITAPSGGTATTCGGGGCTDAGAVVLSGCP